ncbi:MAG: fructosamine kinase family protein [Chloroflexota bacterium]
MASGQITNDHIVSLFQHHLAINPDRLVITDKYLKDFGDYYEIGSDQGDFLLRLAYPPNQQALFYEADMIQREVALRQLIEPQTDIPLPKLIIADSQRTLIDRDFMILQSIPGIFYSDITTLTHAQHDRVFFQLGTYLQQLHSISGTEYGYNGEAEALKGQPNWKDAFEIIWTSLLQDVVQTGLYTRQETQGLLDLFSAYQSYFERSAPPALLQMGIRKENIKVDREGNVTGILNSELSLWGEPELEFAVLDCTGIWASSFWEGYGQARPNDLGSRTRRKFYILYEVLKNIPLSLKRHDDLEEAEQYKQTATTIATNLASSTP